MECGGIIPILFGNFIEYKINNNSMMSAWHPHPMFKSSPLLYGNLNMPYIVRDWASDLLDSYFTLNDLDID